MRPVTAVPDRLPIANMLDVQCGNITREEVYKVISKLKLGKAGGIDNQLPEYFKALVSTDEGLNLIV